MTQPTLRQSVGSPFTRILAVGAARGDLTVTNDDIAGPIDSSDEWIRQRTGVITRKRASATLSAADLATEAAAEAVAKAGISPDQIGAVIIADAGVLDYAAQTGLARLLPPRMTFLQRAPGSATELLRPMRWSDQGRPSTSLSSARRSSATSQSQPTARFRSCSVTALALS